jgi:phosphoribosyl 1,2-cyclic phosphodiesterase
MIVRCWGARGSIPVSGKEFMKYGGDTTCVEIRTKEDDIVIVDSGSGIRRLGNRLMAERRFDCTLLYTHAHWDHLIGFPFFKPIYHRGTRLSIFGCPFAQHSVQQVIARIMTPPNFPISLSELHADLTYHEYCTTSFQIGSLKVTPIALSHPDEGIGYRFEEGEKSFVFLTDNELTYRHPGGLTYDDYCHFSQGADLLIHDAEYVEGDYPKKKAWGHSQYRDALRLALDAGVTRLGLFHHNQERTDAELDAMVEDCRQLVRRSGSKLDCFALQQDMELVL